MEDIEKTVIQHTEQIKTLFNMQSQQEKMMKSLNDLTLSVRELALSQKTLQSDVSTLQTDVDAIKAEPGEKWKDVTSKALWLIIAAVLGVLLGKFGL